MRDAYRSVALAPIGIPVMHCKLQAGGGAPSSETKRLLKPIGEAVLAELVGRGHTLVLSHAQELVAAGFGFHTQKLLLQSGARFVSSSTAHTDGYSQIRTAAIERRCRALMPGISEVEVLSIGMRVTDHLCQSNLVIDAQDAFLHPSTKAQTILCSLAADYETFRPVNASVAIHAGILPKFELAGFRSINVHRLKSSGALFGDAKHLAEGVVSKMVRLWMSAPPDAARFPAPYEDRYQGHDLRLMPDARDSTFARLGAGFCLVMQSQLGSRIQHGPDATVNTTFFTPVAEFAARSGWYFTWVKSSSMTHLSQTKWRAKGAPLLDLGNCPLVEYCAKCDQLHSPDSPPFFAHTGCNRH